MRPIARRSLGALALVIASLPLAAADELGTLFNTPEERARLDKLRRGEPAAWASNGVPSHKPAVTGYVQRSDGRNTVWIDGRPVVVASPGADAIFDPRVVQSGREPPDTVLRIEKKGKEKR